MLLKADADLFAKNEDEITATLIAAKMGCHRSEYKTPNKGGFVRFQAILGDIFEGLWRSFCDVMTLF